MKFCWLKVHRMRLVFGIMIVHLVLGMFLSGCRRSENNGLTSSQLDVPSAVNIVITQEGIYEVPLANIGWEAIDPKLVQLFHRNREIPVWIREERGGAKVTFYGEASSSVYTRENVYQLKVGSAPGLRMTELREELPTNAATIDRIYRTTRLEKNLFYSPLIVKGDHWLWTKLIAPTRYELDFEVEDPAAGDGRIRAAFWGNTEAPTSPDHRATLAINGELVGEGSWDGQARHTLEGVIPEGLLQTGTNRLVINVPGDTGSHFDIIFLDWIEITAPNSTYLTGDQTQFTAEEGVIQIQGLNAEAYLFDITHPEAVSVQRVWSDAAVFEGQEGHRYLAVNPEGWLAPDAINETTLAPDLKRVDTHADYLAIGPQDLLDALTPLLNLRSEQGLTTMAIPVSAIYDQFNGGIAEPEAIRAFLSYAAAEWIGSPKYGLLVGDASYDYWGYTDPVYPNRLPVMMVQTLFGGETGSDVLMAEVDEIPGPDYAIGRLPAQNSNQIKTYVQKVIQYEREIEQPHVNQKILAIADGQEITFKSDAQRFLDLFSKGFNTTLLAPEAGDTNASQSVDQAMESGYWLIAYFGHGSINMWGKDRLFTIEDVLDQGQQATPPIILQFTCLTGLFTHPMQESLTEKLLWRPEGGAIALLGPTSLTLPYEQEYLSSGFVNALNQGIKHRLGDIVLEAWQQVASDSANRMEVMRTFLLFGDPALNLPRFPQD